MTKFGKFVVKRTNGTFKAVAADMCLEQTINRSKKSTSGATFKIGVIGATRKKKFVTEWELIYHEILAISSLYRKLTNVSTVNYDLSDHHDLTQTRTMDMEKHIAAMTKYILEHDNPFPTGSQPLRNIITQQVVEPEVKDDLLKVFAIGVQFYENLRNERFISRSKTISEVIHRNNLPSFNAHVKSNVISERTTKKKIASAQRLIDLARERKYILKNLFQ